EEPAAAKASVVAYAGRVQGGDFKWSFTAADDEDYSVNKALKSALVAYQTSIKSIQGEGQIVIVETPASSSSSNPPASSSSSVDGPTSSSSSVEPPASCSSVEPGSSEDGGDNGGNNGGNNGGSISKIEGDVIHNFTQSGTQSEYFEIVGNLSTSKGSVTFDSETLTQCLKMESSTQIKFNLSKSSAMTLVLNGDFNGNIKVDGKNVEVKNGVVVVNLAAGDHSITKGDSSNLYLIVVKFDDGASAGDIPQMVSNTSPMAPAIRYNSAESRLEIGASDIRRLEIMGVDGGKVRLNDVGNSVDLSRFQSGVYFVRLVTPQKSYIQKIVKK
ncbi:MAG: T9SS type A sorting domain-containing protein, partial [Fibrobacteraceae bacterium]|nr:T9SS type A sorting domain-containing protein [Fibrobacteraceae bacterium]